jgi:DNA-binding NarL/FixJ family response regulator
MISIFLVDDQTIIRHGLQSLLEIQPDLTVVGDAENGQAALKAIATLRGNNQPLDVVLLDMRMPIMDGVATTKQISQDFPDLKVLILTTFDDEEYVSQAMNYGAKGYLLKDSPPEDLAMAIRAVSKGNTHLGPGLFEKILQRSASPENSIPAMPAQFAELSPREREVLDLIANGANNREIASQLYISSKTVKNHVTSILSKLNLRDRTQAALLAKSNPVNRSDSI